MMTYKDNGGPAFPRPYSEKYSDERHHAQTGMTLRDYFAAKAMQGMLACPVQPASDQYMTARDAYAVAGAMLKEGAK